MTATADDLFMEVGSPGTATTLSSPGYTAGGTSINVASTTNWPTATGVIFAIDTVTVVNGVEVQDAGSYNEFEGTVASGTSITNVDWVNGNGDTNYSAGSTTRVYIPVSATRENRLAQGMVVEHAQDGTHGATTHTSISNAGVLTQTGIGTFASHIDVNDSSTAIRDSSDNELVKFSKTTSAVNEITLANAATGNGPEIQATGGDTNIDLELIPKGTGNVTKNTNPIDWWEEIARTTLGSAGDTIDVTSIPERRFLRIIIRCVDASGTINVGLRFNNDSAANYNWRSSKNGAADATSFSQTEVNLSSSTAATPFSAVIDIANDSAEEKVGMFNTTEGGTAGAANTPDRKEGALKWANTSAVISRITVINNIVAAATGDYASGSEVVVLGHD